MTEKFKTILEKCVNKSGAWDIKDGIIRFSIQGFSKSGTVWIYEENGVIKCLARYGEITEIETYDDLVNVAFSWFVRYRDRSPFEEPAWEWADDFIRLGYLKKKVQIVTTYE